MRELVEHLDQRFARLNQSSHSLIVVIPVDKIYWLPRVSTRSAPIYSCGEHVIKSAGSIEQTFGGLTTNLWDDPFEWTLPETLSTRERIAEYLDEVESTRRRGFDLFKSDDDLKREIALPSGEMQAVNELLLRTLVRASHYFGSALATFRLFSDERIAID